VGCAAVRHRGGGGVSCDIPSSHDKGRTQDFSQRADLPMHSQLRVSIRISAGRVSMARACLRYVPGPKSRPDADYSSSGTAD